MSQFTEFAASRSDYFSTRTMELAGSRALPPDVARLFTPAMNAVLAVVVEDLRRNGCSFMKGRMIAADAGVCLSIVKWTLRLARLQGWLVPCSPAEKERLGHFLVLALHTVQGREVMDWITGDNPASPYGKISRDHFRGF